MIKILVSDSLSEEGLKILKEIKEFEVDIKTDLKIILEGSDLTQGNSACTCRE